MDDLLEVLYYKLSEVFDKNLQKKDKIKDGNIIDVLATLLALKKHNNEIRKLVKESSMAKDLLIYDFSEQLVEDSIKSKYLMSIGDLNSNMYSISSYGLYKYYLAKNIPLDNSFISYDESKFPSLKLTLKVQEKIWCIFLIVIGAVDEKNELDTTKPTFVNKMDDYYEFLKIVEKKFNEYVDDSIKVDWTKGKDINFRRFITNAKDLPKTGIYNYSSKKYWLDLSTRSNIKNILDLILGNYKGVNRIRANNQFEEVLFDLSSQVLTVLNENPVELSRELLDELRNG